MRARPAVFALTLLALAAGLPLASSGCKNEAPIDKHGRRAKYAAQAAARAAAAAETAPGGAPAAGPATTKDLLVYRVPAAGRTIVYSLADGGVADTPSLNLPGESVSPVDASADGNLVLCASDRWGTFVYDVAARRRMPLPSAAALGLCPGGRHALTVTPTAAGPVFGILDRERGIDAPIAGLAAAPDAGEWQIGRDARRLAFREGGSGGGIDPNLRVFDRDLRADVFDARALGFAGARGARLTEDGRHLFFLTADGADAVLYDLDRQERRTLPGLASPGKVALESLELSPLGWYAVVAASGQEGPFTADRAVGLYCVRPEMLGWMDLPGIGAVHAAGGDVSVGHGGRFIAGIWADDPASQRRLMVYDRSAGAMVALEGIDAADAEGVILRP